MSDKLWVKNKKFIAGLMILTILFTSFSPIFAKKAEAFIFTDWVNFAVNVVTSVGVNSLWVKEYALDSVAYTITNLIIERIAASTVNWINSGFKGSPAFVTNPEAYFKDMGDKIAGDYIFKNPDLNFLCGPISAKIKLALTKSYLNEPQWQCTLTQVGKNMEDFMNNFEKGGWDSFFEVSQQTQMNPIGAYLQAENQMYLQISTRQGTIKEDLLQGNGFMSYRKCKAGTEIVNGGDSQCVDSYNSCLKNGKASKEECSDALKRCDANIGKVEAGDCKESDKETLTPGSVIQNQLNDALGMGNQRIAVADEINEIVSALLNQLFAKVVGTIGSGLKSLSSPDSSGQKFTDQLSTESKKSDIDKYFKSSDDSVEAIINLPPYDAMACRENPNLPECLPPPGDPNNPDTTTNQPTSDTGGSSVPRSTQTGGTSGSRGQ